MANLKDTIVLGNITTTGNVVGTKIIKSGGTNQQVLLANGDTANLSDLGGGSATDTNTWRKIQLNGTDKLGTGTNTNPLNIKAGKDMSITESSGAFTFTGETNFASFGTHSELGSFKYVISSGTYTRSQAFKTIIGLTNFYGFLNVIKDSSGNVTSYNVIMWGSATIYYLTYTVSSSSWSDTVKYLSTTDHTHSSYADSDHTHDVSIATSSATNELTLAHGTKYALTAGGQSFVFTMPSDTDTNTTKSGVAVCTTAASTVAKTATMPGFELVIGQYIILKVNTTNTARNPTLNVNSTGAKSLFINGTAWSTTNQLYAGEYLASPTSSSWNLTPIYLQGQKLQITRPTTAGNYYSILMGEIPMQDTTNTYTAKTLRDVSFGYQPSTRSLWVDGERVMTGVRHNASTAIPYKIMTITQADYLALTSKDANTLYFIVGA